ncbi:helix-turn-helix transcriptional regulator [Actinomadura formosensis]|uniref:helix-turn-helix transcriptional regulator n=1 Tax=Actinomadura formosensis TaxID=60706 RepID=UPI0008378393|nr:helix-turn-helix transcriptional regulator [Actinomadura formosensis]
MAAKRVRLAQRRRAAGLSQEKLADHLGVERSTVVRWETAVTEPQPWVRPELARALKVTSDELQSLLDDITITEAAPSERLAHILEHPEQADLVTVAQLHERIRQLDEQYDQVPSVALIGSAGQVHGQVKLLRRNARNHRVRKALCEVEAEATIFMSQLVWDVSQRRDHTAPLAYLDEAVTAARHIRDSFTESYAVLRKSFVALYGENDPAKGVALAEHATEVAHQSSPSLEGLGWLHVAEGHAMAGEGGACEAALAHAETQFDRMHPDDIGAEYYTASEYNRMAGSCYLFLGQPQRAEPILQATATALDAKKKSQAIVFGNLTLSLIRQRKLDEARSAMHRTIDAVELTRGGGGLNVVFAAGRELRPWRQEPWVQDVQDRLLALMAAI